ncbi:serine hydrolase [uncultured Sphingomonas sp.]|uniref:serine hydrolase n=1 Tax=uncultured Sphingomonas sp. TaxID=158754 RepID=UPI0035CB2A7B
MVRAIVVMLVALMLGAPAIARMAPAAPPSAATADPALAVRANQLVAILGGTGDFDGYFAPSFHAALPKDKWDAVTAQVVAQLGKPLAIDAIQSASAFSALLRVRFERGIGMIQIAIDPLPPHRVTGLLFTGSELAGDSFDKLSADFRALPGTSGFGVYALGGVVPRLVAGLSPDTPAPLGSAFKLWVLGELSREIGVGKRHWVDVVPVGTASLPSGILQAWPAGTPLTVQALATLMISISDNTATDTLVALEGAALDRFVAARGAPGLAPVLTTRQMFAIKSPANADLAARWKGATPAARRALLGSEAGRLAATPVDAALFTGKPVAIDDLEWFASPAQAAAMLDWLRTDGGETARAILAVNPGIDASTRAKFTYLGFKGGSEPGVITLNFLVKRPDGQWLAVVGNWHRADAAVDTLPFVQLMSRALLLAAAAPLR